MIDRYTTGVFNPPFPEREKGELSLDFCCYKDTFRAVPFVPDSRIFYPVCGRFPVSDWKDWEKNDFQDPIMMSAGFSGTGFFAGSLCSGTFG